MVFLPGTDRSVCEMEDVMKIDTQIVDRYLSGKPLLPMKKIGYHLIKVHW